MNHTMVLVSTLLFLFGIVVGGTTEYYRHRPPQSVEAAASATPPAILSHSFKVLATQDVHRYDLVWIQNTTTGECFLIARAVFQSGVAPAKCPQ